MIISQSLESLMVAQAALMNSRGQSGALLGVNEVFIVRILKRYQASLSPEEEIDVMISTKIRRFLRIEARAKRISVLPIIISFGALDISGYRRAPYNLLPGVGLQPRF
jgi:hypothetical protein